MVSAILGLQSRLAPGAVREELESARDRVAAIADLHASLYRQKSTRDGSLCAHMNELVDRMAQALCDPARIRIRALCEDLVLPVHDAVNVGLIINELVTNAAKHAFAPDASGEIVVSIERMGAAVRLTVSDNGKGLEPPSLGAGLGMRIVQSLVDDLSGELVSLEGPGARWQIEFLVGPSGESP